MLSTFEMSGVGLHKGQPVRVTLAPASAGSGIVFVSRGVEIKVAPCAVSQASERATCLCCGQAQVGTVEHLLAALAFTDAADVSIAVEGPELPHLDGSSAAWLCALVAAGATVSPRWIALDRAIRVEGGDSMADVVPVEDPADAWIDVTIDFGRPELGRQRRRFSPLGENFAEEIAPARTFALEEDARRLQSRGLAQGGSLETALVIGPSGPLSASVRFEDEPVRHKILDAFGDFALLGGVPLAQITLIKPGHQLLHRAVRQISTPSDAPGMILRG